MPNPSPFAAIRGPIINPKDGAPTWAFLQELIEWKRKLDNVATRLGEIASGAIIQGRTEGIGTTVVKLTSAGLLADADQILADGVSFVRVSPNQRTGGANAFIGLDSAGDVQRDVKTDRVIADSVKTDSITTPKVIADAINEVAAFSNDATINTTSGTEIEVADVTVVSNTGTVEVIGKVETIAAAVSGTLRIRKTNISGAILDQAPGTTGVLSIVMIGVDISPAASQKYVVTLERNSGSNIGVKLRRMIGGNRKR